MSWKNFLLIFLFTAISINKIAAQDKENSFRVMTYNIRYAGSEQADGINAWKNRREMVASVIRFNQADIIGLQEALINQIEDLISLLPHFAWAGVGRDDGKLKGELSAILYQKDRFDLIESSNFWLSETPDKPSMGWDAAFNRIVTWAKFKDRLTGNNFYHFNTHFDHRGIEARLNSVKLILKKVEEIAGDNYVVVTGDFNFRPESENYSLLINGFDVFKPLKDAQHISKYGHYGGNITFNDFGRSLEDGNKIDYIFVKNEVEVLQHGIISEKFNGRFPSDHMPVLAELKIN
jgi:endonuclease/exonuclease/phosphatase family metal-dependent hydrolase